MGEADRVLERKILTNQLVIWRAVGVATIMLLFALAYYKGIGPRRSPCIASISVSEELFENLDREKNLTKIAEDPNIKAVIFNISSPGGSSYGGESLYSSILEISQRKPVVAVMGTLATSAGYMASLSAHHIIARNSTITGSIGAIFISPEFSELAKKLGVNFIVLKKGKYKAEPLPFNGPASQDVKEMVGSLLDDQYNMFFNLVVKHREISETKLRSIADGRLLTGSQALEAGLIDQIGATKEALEWLASQNIDVKNLRVQEIPVNEAKRLGLLPTLKSMILGAKHFFQLFSDVKLQA